MAVGLLIIIALFGSGFVVGKFLANQFKENKEKSATSTAESENTDTEGGLLPAPEKEPTLKPQSGFEIAIFEACDLGFKFSTNKSSADLFGSIKESNIPYDTLELQSISISSALPQTGQNPSQNIGCFDSAIPLESFIKLEGVIQSYDENNQTGILENNTLTKEQACDKTNAVGDLCNDLRNTTVTELISETAGGKVYEYHFVLNDKTYFFGGIDNPFNEKPLQIELQSSNPSTPTIELERKETILGEVLFQF